jgi:cytochrome bd ubiquinol oxidase subunit II
MEALWFWAVAYMLVMYVLLDGYDLGTGIIHLFVAKSDLERRTVLKTIGPVWDGNEVWLIAAGGTLFFAFPVLYASSFSGFYLPLIIVLWLLMLRGLGIELRHQIDHPMWKTFWDAAFMLGSFLLSIFFGAALGNVVRGVPLQKDGFFFEPLWTTFTVVPESGILDWFTVLMALVSLSTLTAHGANWVAMKTEGDVQARARMASKRAWFGVAITSIGAVIATSMIRPGIWDNFTRFPLGFLFPLLGIFGVAGMFYFNRTGQDFRALVSSSAFIVGMLGATAFGLYPNLLPASTDPAYSLNVYNASAKPYALEVGLTWWIIGILLALGYVTYLHIAFKGKVTKPIAEEGY